MISVNLQKANRSFKLSSLSSEILDCVVHSPRSKGALFCGSEGKMTIWFKGWASGRICWARGVHEYFWLLWCRFQAHINLQAHVWSHETHGFKRGPGGLVDTHTQRRDGKEKEKEGGETETVFAEYFHWVAYTFVNILFFSQSDSAVTQFLSQQ